MRLVGRIVGLRGKAKWGVSILERLGRLVGNRKWMDMFPNARMRTLDFYGSDHCPVWCIFQEEDTKVVDKGRGRILFEDKWFMEKTFVPDVLCELRYLEGKGDLSKKLGLCWKFMSMWAKSKCNMTEKAIEDLRKTRVEVMRRLRNDGAVEELAELSRCIEEVVEIDALNWKHARVQIGLITGTEIQACFTPKP